MTLEFASFSDGQACNQSSQLSFSKVHEIDRFEWRYQDEKTITEAHMTEASKALGLTQYQCA